MPKVFNQLTNPTYPEMQIPPSSSAARKAILKGLSTPADIERDYWEWKANRPRDVYEIDSSFHHYLKETSTEFLVSEKRDNCVYSPFCLYHSLLFMVNLCAGETRDEILHILDETDLGN